MTPTPVIKARELIRFPRQCGFVEVRSRGSHRRFAHTDGRRTTVPVHRGRDLPRRLLRQIITVDVGMTMEEFVAFMDGH